MIADGYSTMRESYALGFNATTLHSYRVEVSSRHDGRTIVSLLVMDDAPGARWTGRWLVVCDTYPEAQLAKASIADRLRDVKCLRCGRPLLLEEVFGHRGICCYSCDDVRRRNGGRWPQPSSSVSGTDADCMEAV